jgi:hypothetical protein
MCGGGGQAPPPAPPPKPPDTGPLTAVVAEGPAGPLGVGSARAGDTVTTGGTLGETKAPTVKSLLGQ